MAKDFKEQFEGQHEDEEVLLFFRRHIVVLRKGLIAVMIGLLIGSIPILVDPLNLKLLWAMPIGALIGGLYLFALWIGWYYSVFIVTNQRFIRIVQKGLFKRSVIDLGLDKIQNVNFQIDGLQQTLLQFGTMVVQTFVGDLILENIHHPEQTQQSVVRIIKEYGQEFTQEA